jgi:hypothetical protein
MGIRVIFFFFVCSNICDNLFISNIKSLRYISLLLVMLSCTLVLLSFTWPKLSSLISGSVVVGIVW